MLDERMGLPNDLKPSRERMFESFLSDDIIDGILSSKFRSEERRGYLSCCCSAFGYSLLFLSCFSIRFHAEKH